MQCFVILNFKLFIKCGNQKPGSAKTLELKG